jgi:exodeoxyribonuclease V alpha subunit
VTALPWPDPAAVAGALRRSPLVVGSPLGRLRPLRLVDTDAGPLLYLERYWRLEQSVRDQLHDRALTRPPIDLPDLRRRLDDLFAGAAAPDRQRIAAALAATRWTTVLTGGPGTGKTTTVARVLALLALPGTRVALAAPTGKAAARLQESVREQAAGLALPDDLTAVTLHRLLGWRPDSRTRFRHDAEDRLPYDLVVVDETSMVSLTLMARLLEALRPDARLVLVGDPDQLTSVDAGAVLADLVARPVPAADDPVLADLVGADLSADDDPEEAGLSPGERGRLRNGIVRLSRGRRFGGTIARLATAVREGDADGALVLLRSGERDVSFVEDGASDAVEVDVVRAANAVTAAAEAGDVDGALARLEQHRVLCAHRTGPSGVARWDRRSLEWAAAGLGRRLGPVAAPRGTPRPGGRRRGTPVSRCW